MTTAYSILDLARVTERGSIADSFADCVSTAQAAERLGYNRVWYAEHHNMASVASSATSVLIAHIAAQTKTIRLGSGGVMLPNHSPLTIAEQFGTLATLHPGRIDLGLGRAPGTDQTTMRALRRRPEDAEDFPEQVQQLQQLLGPNQYGQKLKAIPGGDTNVPVWLLGSSLFSAQLAAQMGLPYAFAAHFAPRMLLEAVTLYKNNFRPSAQLAEPYVMIGVPVIVADTEQQARVLATSGQQKILSLFRGEPVTLAPPVASMEGLWLPHEKQGVDQFLSAAAIGAPEQVANKLNGLLAQTGAHELMVVTDIYETGARHHSLSLLTELAKG